MNSEQFLINKWRGLTSVEQQEVLDFVEFMAQKSYSKNQLYQREQRAKKWLDWASDNPSNSPSLPDEALSRDSIYD